MLSKTGKPFSKKKSGVKF